ncbi:sugar transferase [bacterium]|nr:sugar transferase [bacterium]
MIPVSYLASGGVFFCQARVKKGNMTFTLFKFQTMKPKQGEQSDTERVTPLGTFLRRTSLDELPQLLNVIRGDMGLIGPRPLLPEYQTRYSPYQIRRHEVRPGITGWAQVHGRNNTTWEERLAYDVWYVDHYDMWVDLRIIFKTIRLLLLSGDREEQGDISIESFRGERENNGE